MLFLQLDPHWRMVAGLFPAAYVAIDARRLEARRELRAQQKMVDADAGIALEGVAKVIPEREDLLAGIKLAQRVGPPLVDELAIRRARLWKEERVLDPVFRLLRVELRRDHVVIARQHDRRFARDQLRSMQREPLEPLELVIELRP